MLLTLNALHLMSLLPRAAFLMNKSTVPAVATREPVTERVAVLRHGARLAVCTIEGEGGYRITATATAVFASALVDAVAMDRSLSGCFDAQDLFTLQQLDPHLRRAGVNIIQHRAGVTSPFKRSHHTPRHVRRSVMRPRAWRPSRPARPGFGC